MKRIQTSPIRPAPKLSDLRRSPRKCMKEQRQRDRINNLAQKIAFKSANKSQVNVQSFTSSKTEIKNEPIDHVKAASKRDPKAIINEQKQRERLNNLSKKIASQKVNIYEAPTESSIPTIDVQLVQKRTDLRDPRVIISEQKNQSDDLAIKRLRHRSSVRTIAEIYDNSIPPATEAPSTKTKRLLISKIDSCAPVQANNHPPRTISELCDTNQTNVPTLSRIKIKDLSIAQGGRSDLRDPRAIIWEQKKRDELNKNLNKRSQIRSLIGFRSPITIDEKYAESDSPSTSKTIAEIYSEADSKHASKQTRRISGTIAEIYARSNSPSPPLLIAEINSQSLPVVPKSFETETNTVQANSPSQLPTLAENIPTQFSQTTKTIAKIYGKPLPTEASTSRKRSLTREPTIPLQTSQPKKKTIAYIYDQSLNQEAPSSSPKINSQVDLQSLTTRSSKNFGTTKIKNILIDNNTTPVQIAPIRVGLRDSNYQ